MHTTKSDLFPLAVRLRLLFFSSFCPWVRLSSWRHDYSIRTEVLKEKRESTEEKKNWVTKTSCCYIKGRIFFFKEVWRIIYISLVNFTWKTKRKTREKKGEFFLLLLLFFCQKETKNLCSILFPSSLSLYSLTRNYRHVLCSVCQSIYVWFLLFFFPIFF
jgi:hypothetical protein